MERRKEMFYLTMHSKKNYLQLYSVGHMVKNHSDSERGNPLPPHGLLFPISSKKTCCKTYLIQFEENARLALRVAEVCATLVDNFTEVHPARFSFRHSHVVTRAVHQVLGMRWLLVFWNTRPGFYNSFILIFRFQGVVPQIDLSYTWS